MLHLKAQSEIIATGSLTLQGTTTWWADSLNFPWIPKKGPKVSRLFSRFVRYLFLLLSQSVNMNYVFNSLIQGLVIRTSLDYSSSDYLEKWRKQIIIRNYFRSVTGINGKTGRGKRSKPESRMSWQAASWHAKRAWRVQINSWTDNCASSNTRERIQSTWLVRNQLWRLVRTNRECYEQEYQCNWCCSEAIRSNKLGCVDRPHRRVRQVRELESRASERSWIEAFWTYKTETS